MTFFSRSTSEIPSGGSGGQSSPGTSPVGPAPDGHSADYVIPDILYLENILRPGLEPGVIGV